jgi:hypothetical protein
MGFQNYISYKFYTDNIDIKVEQFTYLAIKNQDSLQAINMGRDDDGGYWPLQPLETFSYPLQGAAYDIVTFDVKGAEYSIMTDGVITPL